MDRITISTSIVLLMMISSAGLLIEEVEGTVEFFGPPSRDGELTMDMNVSEIALASFIGEGAANMLGRAISYVDDVNGDGCDDFLIGAIANDEGGIDAGQSYLIFGKNSGWEMDTEASMVDASFIGENSDDQSGRSVSGVGDINGDGFSDFMIGARYNDDGGNRAGKAYLITATIVSLC